MPDELPDDMDVEEDPVETATSSAAEMNEALNQMKRMALQAATELETMAEYAESSDAIQREASELQEAAGTIRRVYQRIEHGDSNMVQQ